MNGAGTLRSVIEAARRSCKASRLGSDHPGERAAAGLKADQLVRGLGLTWADVLAPRPPAPTWPPPRRWIEPDTPQDAARTCLYGWPQLLSDWEKGFCASLIGRWRIRPKQQRCMDRITAKVRLVALAEEGCP